MRHERVTVEPGASSLILGGGVGLALSPAATFGGEVRVDRGLHTLPVLPGCTYRLPWQQLAIEWPTTASSGFLDVVVLEAEAEAITWPAPSVVVEQISAGESNTVASGNIDIPIPALDSDLGEGRFVELLGGCYVASTLFNFNVQVWESVPVVGDVMIDAVRAPASAGGNEFISFRSLAYPISGGYLRINRSAGVGAATFFHVLHRTSPR